METATSSDYTEYSLLRVIASESVNFDSICSFLLF